MGRFIRSVLAVFGVVALLICLSSLAQVSAAGPGVRGPTMAVLFLGELFCVGFLMLVRKPFFAVPERPRTVDRPTRALAVLFGLLQLYPGASAVLLAAYDPAASDRGVFAAIGAGVFLTGCAFVYGGLRGLLQPMIAPDALADS